MTKDPSPRADALRAMREERRGHLQATIEPPKRKLVPYAGKEPVGRGPAKVKDAGKKRKWKVLPWKVSP